MKCFGHFFKCVPIPKSSDYRPITLVKIEDMNYHHMGFNRGKPKPTQLDILYEDTRAGVSGNPGPYYLYIQNKHIIQVSVKSNGKELPMRRMSEKQTPSSDYKLTRADTYPEFLFYCEKDDIELELECKCRDESDDFTAKLHMLFNSSGSNPTNYTFGDITHFQCNTGFSFGTVSFNWPKGVDRTVVSIYLRGVLNYDKSNIHVLNKIDEISVNDKNQRRVIFTNLPFGEYSYVVRQYLPNGKIYFMTNYEPMFVKNL